jgi:hypothetical protein
VRIPDESVEVNLGAGRASFSLQNVSIPDYGSILNALNDIEPTDGTVSFTLHWNGVKGRRQVQNDTLHVAGLFLDTDATILWTGSNAHGSAFTADVAGQTVISAQIGHERNGVFF